MTTGGCGHQAVAESDFAHDTVREFGSYRKSRSSQGGWRITGLVLLLKELDSDDDVLFDASKSQSKEVTLESVERGSP